MCQLYRGKYYKIKEGQEVKHAKKIVKLVEGINKESTSTMEIEWATKSDDADILRQVWDERGFMRLPHVQYLKIDIKRNALERIRNGALCYWRYQGVKSFICHMREMYGEPRDTKLWLIRVQDQSKYSWKHIRVINNVVMICRSASWWEWLGGSTLFFYWWSNNYRYESRWSGKAYILGDLPRFSKHKYLNKQS